MHAAEVYFNFMTAIEENEAFSDLWYTTLVVRGSQEFSVFYEDGIPLCREFALQILEYFYFSRKLKYRFHSCHWTNAFAFVATNSCELVLIRAREPVKTRSEAECYHNKPPAMRVRVKCL